MRSFTVAMLCCPGLFVASPACGQNVSVQQPVLSSFQVNTTVSVPDSGGTFVAGARRAVSGTTTQGLVPAGSVVGREARGSTLQARVTIHDLAGLDDEILAAAAGLDAERLQTGSSRGLTKGTNRPDTKVNPRLELAWRQLQHESAPAGQRFGAPTPARTPAADRSNSRQPAGGSQRGVGQRGVGQAISEPEASQEQLSQAHRLYREGLAAQTAGRRKLALAFLRTAAQQGSVEAREELGRLRVAPPGAAVNATNPTKDVLSSGLGHVDRAVAQPLGFEAKSNSKRSGSARN